MPEKMIDICSADSLDDEPVPPTIISIKKPISLLWANKDKMISVEGTFRIQGKELCDALLSSLPGGTVDALLCELLDRKRSELRVPFNKGQRF